MPQQTAMPSAEEVRFAQQVMQGAGYYDGPITGNFDIKTYEAIKAYQVARGLGTSGMLDFATASDMGKLVRYASGQGDSPTPDIDAKVYELYGPAIGAYLNHSELGPLLRQAAQENWDELRLEGALQQTNWWHQTGESAREWDEKNLTDSASANDQRRERAALIYDLTQQIRAGTNALSAQMFDQIVEDSLRFGWDDGQIMDMLVSLTSYNPQRPEPGGVLGTLMAQVKATAADYFINLGDEEAFRYAQRIQANELTNDGMLATFRAQAMSRFANTDLAQLIDNGVLPADYFSEHQRTIARVLGLGDPSTVDFLNDATWQRVLSYKDPDTGGMRPMTIPEVEIMARQQDGWREMPEANEKAANLEKMILEEFGRLA